jgi:hypothetical protein
VSEVIASHTVFGLKMSDHGLDGGASLELANIFAVAGRPIDAQEEMDGFGGRNDNADSRA